ncbi:MAG: hypothetical protein QCI38_06055, partial [Candidatus Thermoplasmatota archaeon]|nr:hypothetical protein [Candidatus Thermoplasmatota archaeon]
LFKYRCLLQSTSGGDRTAQGLVWVDAVSGSWMEMKPGFETVEDLDTPNFKMEPVIELSAATDIALEGIMGMNTRETEEVRHTGSATIFEKQKTFPVQSSIETEMAGILYVPMWNIEGSRGTMTINAVSASIVRESLYEE